VLPSGNLRVVADTWITANGARWYTREYVDNSPSFGGVIGSPKLVTGPETEGGSNITISSPTIAALVHNAAQLQPNPTNLPLSKIGINGLQNSAYSIIINNLAFAGSVNPLNTAAYPAIGFQTATGTNAVLTGNSLAGTLLYRA
jgi:hypothetical protein